MYVEETTRKIGDKVHRCFMLRESFRENGKVRKRTIANISHLPAAEINALRIALRVKSAGVQPEDIRQQVGPSIGALFVVLELCKRLGITKALGSDRKAKLALWLIFSRLVEQGSRLSSIRLAERHDLSLLGIESFNEDDLYEALDWLVGQQEEIQQQLFQERKQATQLFLYDVTSSYLEGVDNELSWWGHNRDGKKGKMQIVFGMLTDQNGVPVAVEVFDGNASDPITFLTLVRGFGKRFGVKKVTFVGDKGMIKRLGIEALHEEGFSYITSMTRAQINKLMKDGVVQLSLFEDELHEVESEGIRYLLRRNPVQAVKVAATRNDKLQTLREKANKATKYLCEHPKASCEVSAKRVEEMAEKLDFTKFVEIKIEGRTVTVEPVVAAWQEDAKLDGCYVIQTDIPATSLDMNTVHQRYRDLSKVEKCFRTMKTGLLEVRPIWLRKANRTRAHVFVCMLAYMVERELRKICSSEKETVKDVIEELKRIVRVDLVLPEQTIPSIPAPPPRAAGILAQLGLKLPVLSAS